MVYRTNSYNNREPCYDRAEIALALSEQSPNDIYQYFRYTLCDNEAADFLSDMAREDAWTNGNTLERVDAYQDFFHFMHWYGLSNCIWFCKTKDSILDCNRYGRNLTSENGVLRCYDEKKARTIFQYGDNILLSFEEVPLLAPDTVINQSLINEGELARLRDIENKYEIKPVKTHRKKDVYNIFKLEENGLLKEKEKPIVAPEEQIVVTTSEPVDRIDTLLDLL